MVTHQPKDGHPPDGCKLQTRNLALRLNSQNRWKMMEFDTEELILVFVIFSMIPAHPWFDFGLLISIFLSKTDVYERPNAF